MTAARRFTVTMEHDDGTVNITIGSSSKEAAVAAVLRAETAPSSAVKAVVELANDDCYCDYCNLTGHRCLRSIAAADDPVVRPATL